MILPGGDSAVELLFRLPEFAHGKVGISTFSPVSTHPQSITRITDLMCGYAGLYIHILHMRTLLRKFTNLPSCAEMCTTLVTRIMRYPKP